MKPLKELSDTVTSLPRGGYLVDTPAGYIQFGSPPETIKDTMLLPEGVPLIFVLPAEFFNWIKGISIAELEFPIYYNFFLKKKKTRIICYDDQAMRFKKVLQEALFGPENPNFTDDFDERTGIVHDIKKEMDYFRTMNLSDVVEFLIYENDSCVVDGITIEIDPSGNFELFEGERVLGYVPGWIEYKPRYQIGERLKEPFNPPLFGMTCLGPSSGFDPYENTSGYIIWLNHHGIMVDPPVNSTEWLLDSNVSPKYIDSIILTHCHADHDAGTFQKILEEWKVTIYTTETIITSFLKKYSAFTDVSVDYLQSLFDFQPVRIGKPLFIHGGMFDMFYSLHSIPAIGFRIEFQNQSMTYSSDHNNDPKLHRKLLKDGVITKDRYNELKNFPWDSTAVYHESGYSPLHTPIEFLNSLPAEIQKKTIVYHISEKDMPEKTSLTLAKFGIEHTKYFKTKSPPFEKTYRVLGLLKSLDFFQNMSVKNVQNFISIVNEEKFKKGNRIISRGDNGDRFYIIYSGNVSIRSDDGKYTKIYGTYDYFGEAALLTDGKRTTDVVAETDVVLYSIEKHRFLNFICATDSEKLFAGLINIRDEEAWEIFSTSRFLKIFTATQRAFLELILRPVDFPSPGVLIKEGEILESIYIIRSGKVTAARSGINTGVLQKGDIVGFVSDIYNDNPSNYRFYHETPLSLYEIRKKDFRLYLDRNPGLIMKLNYLFNEILKFS